MQSCSKSCDSMKDCSSNSNCRSSRLKPITMPCCKHKASSNYCNVSSNSYNGNSSNRYSKAAPTSGVGLAANACACRTVSLP